MPTIYKVLGENVEIDAQETAKLFCTMQADEQAVFFNTIAEIFDSWVIPFPDQLKFIVDSARLNAAGISIMEQIGEYAKALKEDLQKYKPEP